MASEKKRLRVALPIFGASVAVVAGAAWFLVVPHIIESELNSSLEYVAEKTGRSVVLTGLRLNGLASAKIERISISDVDQPEHVGAAFNQVRIELDRIPWNGKARISAIHADDVDITLRRENHTTNFDDIIAKLKKNDGGNASTPSQSSRWKQWITPLPEISIGEVALKMTPIQIKDDWEIGALSGSNIHIIPGENSKTLLPIQLSGNLSALFVESGEPTIYESKLTGHIQSETDGEIILSYPQSSKKTAPVVFKEGNVEIRYANVSFSLPSTFAVSQLSVVDNTRPMFEAQQIRARLMAFPPKKVSGVYFKEIELAQPVIHEYLRGRSTAITSWLRALKTSWQKIVPSKNTGQTSQKKKSPKDYFFSQRMFVTDGKITLEDNRDKPMVNFELDNLNVEIGYRSIRKVLDYRIAFRTEEPLGSTIQLSGVYEMHGDEHARGALDVAAVKAGDSLKKFQINLREPREDLFDKTVNAAIDAKRALDEKSGVAKQVERTAQSAAAVLNAPSGYVQDSLIIGFFKKFLPNIDFEHARFDAHLAYDYAVKKSTLSLETKFSTNGATYQIDAISREPLALNGALSGKLHADFAKKTFSLDEIVLSTGGESLAFDINLSPAQRQVKNRKTGAAETQDDWQFKLHAKLEPQPLQTLFDAIPHALRPDLDGLTWIGTLGLDLSAEGFWGDLAHMRHAFNLTTSPDIDVLQWPVDRDIHMLNAGFTYHVNDPNALQPHDIAIPPSIYPVIVNNETRYAPAFDDVTFRETYPEWVLFDDINPWLIQLITTTEDGSFFTHNGFSALQIKAALARNVSESEFARGASTISMQLVKNIFFDRTKSLSRKFQEVLYTWLMESVVKIPKKRIMELYFNIIEFGPEIYGIEEAAKYYFGKRSNALSLKECAFLMAIIPNPRKGAEYRMAPALGKGIQKMMNFYIREMYRRKCDPVRNAEMKERFLQKNIPIPFEPCCPPQDSLSLMLESDTLAFHIPNPKDPTVYAYRPDLYDENGVSLIPVNPMHCGYHGDVNTLDDISDDAADDIFIMN